jgi:hypothetical protein
MQIFLSGFLNDANDANYLNYKHGLLQLALCDSVQFALENGYHRVAFEYDAQEVIKLVNEIEVGISEIVSIIQEIQELSAFFTSFCFSDIFRDGNDVAHLCANMASAKRRRCLWVNYKPQFLLNVLENNCNKIAKRGSSFVKIKSLALKAQNPAWIRTLSFLAIPFNQFSNKFIGLGEGDRLKVM